MSARARYPLSIHDQRMMWEPAYGFLGCAMTALLIGTSNVKYRSPALNSLESSVSLA